MADEHNARMLGAAGHPLVQTPNLDRLASRGTRFSNAYTNCPICVPARASFATGHYVHQHHYWDNSIAYDGRVTGWGHRLQAAGIRVESIGKLHYRNAEDPTGFDRQHIPMHIADGVGMVHMSIRGQFPDFVPPQGLPRPKAPFEEAGPGESEYTLYDRRVADVACEWLADSAAAQEPWVLFVSFVAPHFPLIAPEEYFSLYPVQSMPPAKFGINSGFVPHPWVARFARRIPTPAQQQIALAAYLGLCTFMDAQVGRVLQALEDASLADSTRIIYTSDHGENAGSRGLWGKSVHYQEAAAIPLILAGDGVPEGKVSETPVSLVDCYPAVLDALALDTGMDDCRPGESWFEFASREDLERPVLSEYHAAGSLTASYMLRRGNYKYIHYVDHEPELFDLAEDPEEQNPVGNLLPRVRQAMEAELRSMLDLEQTDAMAKQDQKELINRLGGPDAVMANLVTTKGYTPVPAEYQDAGQDS